MSRAFVHNKNLCSLQKLSGYQKNIYVQPIVISILKLSKAPFHIPFPIIMLYYLFKKILSKWI